MHGPLVLLGPQAPLQNARAALDAHGVTERIALVTGGWRWDEGDVSELAKSLGRPAHHLPIYHWFENVMSSEHALKAQYRERQDRILAYKELYRLRLHAALGAARELGSRRDAPPDLWALEQRRALDAVRQIDADLASTLASIRRDYPIVARPFEVPGARMKHEEVKLVLRNAGAVVIAGGHVAVLRNRLFFFGFEKLIAEVLASGRPVIAWSAGAMALCKRVVLFYDDPPEGHGEAEVLDSGLGLVDDLILFPHARQRLRLAEEQRVSHLATRCHPYQAIGMESGAWLERMDGAWKNRGELGSAVRFELDGRVLAVEAP